MRTEDWIDEILPKAEKKMKSMVARNRGKIPYMASGGVYDDMAKEKISWWTNGFYAGELWQFYHLADDNSYRENAESIEKMLDEALADFKGLHHDVGFMWMLTAVADYKITGNEHSKDRALHAATLLAGRFNLKGNFLRSWNQDHVGWVIIDSMMNIAAESFTTTVRNFDRRLEDMIQQFGEKIEQSNQKMSDNVTTQLIAFEKNASENRLLPLYEVRLLNENLSLLVEGLTEVAASFNAQSGGRRKKRPSFFAGIRTQISAIRRRLFH